MEICHNSDSITIVLNIIRSSVGGTIGASCYTKEGLVLSVPLVTGTCFTSIKVDTNYRLKIKASVCFKSSKLQVNTLP